MRMLVVLLWVGFGIVGYVYSAEKTHIELWRVGDDGLTLRLADAIESSLKSSPTFSLSTGKKPGTLLLTIPTNVNWRKVGNRTQVLYRVEYSTAGGKRLGASTGSCWDDGFNICAKKIVNDAEVAARTMR